MRKLWGGGYEVYTAILMKILVFRLDYDTFLTGTCVPSWPPARRVGS